MNPEEIKNKILEIASSGASQNEQINQVLGFMNNSGLPEQAQNEVVNLLSQNLPLDMLNANLGDLLSNYLGGSGVMDAIGVITEGTDLVNSFGDFFGGDSGGE